VNSPWRALCNPAQPARVTHGLARATQMP
jgi:hypothetical protein